MCHDERAMISGMSRRFHAANTQIANSHCLQILHGIFWFQPRNTFHFLTTSNYFHFGSLLLPVQISVNVVPMFVRRQYVRQFRIELLFEVTDHLVRLLNVANVNRDQLISLRLLYHIPNIVRVELVKVKVRQ